METTHHEHQRFDVLRGLMALIVLFSHTSQVMLLRLTGEKGALAVLSGAIARQAVLVFFLLSGFLITRSILKNIRRHQYFEVPEYVLSRIARIYFPLLGSILLCCLLWIFLREKPLSLPGDHYAARDAFTFSRGEIKLSLLMLSGLLNANGPLWSLYIEFHLYMAVLIATLPKARGAASRFFCLVMGVTGLYLLRDWPFLAGIWLIGASFEIWKPTRRVATLLVLFSLAVVAAILVVHRAAYASEMDTPFGWLAQTASSMLIAAVIFPAFPKVAYPAWLVRTGDFSYSLYVIHFPILLGFLAYSLPWMGHSMSRALVVSAASDIAIVGAAIFFASVTERPKFFYALLKKGFDAASMRLSGLMQLARRPG